MFSDQVAVLLSATFHLEDKGIESVANDEHVLGSAWLSPVSLQKSPKSGRKPGVPLPFAYAVSAQPRRPHEDLVLA